MRARVALASAVAAAAAAGIGIAAALGAFSSSSGPAAAPAAVVRVEAHATITVLGSNGKTVRTRRVPVHLLPLGASHAGHTVWSILSGRNVAGAWDVTLGGTACPASNGHFCQLFEVGAKPASFDAAADAKSLEVTLGTAGVGEFKAVVAGTLPIARAGTIARVATGLQTCPARSTAGRDCGAGYNPITDRYLSPPVRVSPRQRISIRVEIGFGT